MAVVIATSKKTSSYSYERLDGSARAHERNLAINNFKKEDIFIFLLSTKAGGVGLNLEEADTVIFLDSDFNPQNDLQAESRCHRIGQKRPVKVIRLLGRDTVEEIVYSCAVSKQHLTNAVIEEGRFSLLPRPQTAAQTSAKTQLSEILKFGLHNLLSSDESSVQHMDLQKVLGKSREGEWLIDEQDLRPAEEEENEDEEKQTHMYFFEGKDYSKLPSTEDERRFELMLGERSDEEDEKKEGRVLRHKSGVLLSGCLATPSRRKRPLTESELEERRKKREETAAKKAKVQEEQQRQRERQKYRKKMAWWKSCGYKSLCLPSADSEDEDEDEEDNDISSANSTDSDDTAIRYVLGDVTHPQAEREDAIIVHCVDDSGGWGRGGLFTALELRSDEVKKQYELAGEMDDLELGNVLLFSIDDKQSRLSGTDYLALIVVQRRDKSNKLSGICLTALEEGLKKIYRAAKQKKASVHLPRIGHATKGFNWYGTERLIRKHLASRRVPTFIYYYKRQASRSTTTASSTDTAIPSTSRSAPSPPAPLSPTSSRSLSPPAPLSPTSSRSPSPPAPLSPTSSRSLSPPAPSEERSESPEGSGTTQQSGEASGLTDFMRGVRVFFYNLGAEDRKKLTRYLITYDGDEEDTMSSRVTHIVAEVGSPLHVQELQEVCERCPRAIPVKKKWLECCFADQRKVGASKYIHHFR